MCVPHLYRTILHSINHLTLTDKAAYSLKPRAEAILPGVAEVEFEAALHRADGDAAGSEHLGTGCLRRC